MRNKALLLLVFLTLLATAGFTSSALARTQHRAPLPLATDVSPAPRPEAVTSAEMIPTSTPASPSVAPTPAIAPTPAPTTAAAPLAPATGHAAASTSDEPDSPDVDRAQPAKQVRVPVVHRWVGFYMPGVPDSMTSLDKLQKQIGAHASVVNFFIADSEAFPAPRCANADAAGATPLVTLEFWSIKDAGGLSAILDGSHDAYLTRFAQAAKAYGKTVWLRPFHEMNGDWYPWGTTGGNTPAQFIAAYRHVHDVFASAGATNVKFVWCPNVDFNVVQFYPGDAYVDYAAIDGYNTGLPWRSFSSVFGKTYTKVAAITPKPIFIAETSCAEGNRKADWIADMFAQIATSYPRLTGACWFNVNKEHDWRIGSSASSLHAFAAGVAKSF
ncbi:MAG: glycosyl hydrolase [Coriobacteriia bacterium]|nr:glycosyl hydrolase [Coriobacteriia bacterium]